jgi:hypothetical protein
MHPVWKIQVLKTTYAALLFSDAIYVGSSLLNRVSILIRLKLDLLHCERGLESQHNIPRQA